MLNEIKTIWTKGDGKRGIEPMVLGRRINRQWLQGSVSTTSVRFGGELQNALTDLWEVAKAGSKNLPIVSLRLLLQAAMVGVINVDRDLGCNPENLLSAIDLHESPDNDDELPFKVSELVERWCINHLEEWAHRDNLGDLAVRIKKACNPENVCISTSKIDLRDAKSGEPNFGLIAKLIADQLAGESLFENMGSCEVVFPESRSYRSIELMSKPCHPLSDDGGKNQFSMVARIHVSTMPYSEDLYFSVSCSKRVWSDKAPDGANTGRRVTGYVFAPGRTIIPVSIFKQKTESGWRWEFDASYAALNLEAKGSLPPTLKEAQSSTFSKDAWWAGLPQITRLFRKVDQHTALESDEVDLLNKVLPLLTGIVDADQLSVTPMKIALNRKPEQAMLRLTDVGAAGLSIADEEDESEEVLDEEELLGALSNEERKLKVASFKAQCVQVLSKAYFNEPVNVWIIGGSKTEQDIARKATELLFGPSINFYTDPLPPDVHGLQKSLPGSELQSRQRFQLRIEAWKRSGLPQAIARSRGQRFVLICADKDIERRSEDAINRRAAIHAICSIGLANVHHVLPIEKTSSTKFEPKATQAYVHRLQSALMDVMLAHSGYVIGAKEFVSDQLDKDNIPGAIYGVQALRKQAQQFTGETPISMIVYSKLDLNSNITQFNFIYRAASQTQNSGWKPLSQALVWLGSQRNITSDESWLKTEFQAATVKTLTAIANSDPKAVVFIDWASCSGLWREITDASLMKAEPRIGHLELAREFPKMSFVRIRYGRDAKIPIRSLTRTMYAGFREEASRQPTGEYFEDSYSGTVKQLIKINSESQSNSRGHFIGVMGPRSTNQLKRGQSCYRMMVRMSPLSNSASGKKEKGIFQKTAIPPCNKDSSISASTDITVLHCPMEVDPVEIATLAMGLRVGYAHYSDWTMLPAPLFFIRKIDDYIVKYPIAEALSEEEAVNSDVISQYEVLETVAEIETESPNMRLISGLVQTELNLEFDNEPTPSSPPVPDQAAKDTPKPSSRNVDIATLLSPARLALMDEDRSNLENQLLEIAKATEVILLYPTVDKKSSRLLMAMARDEIKVQVEVPYFVELKGFFGEYNQSLKSKINSSWKEMRKLGYVALTDKLKPPREYLDWLSEKLRKPQGACVISPLPLFGRLFILPKVQTIFETYNKSAKQPIPSHVREGKTLRVDFSPIVRKAIEEQDDETLGWLVFAAAQTPAFGFATSIIQAITSIPGPRTFGALYYYVQCFTTISEALSTYQTSRKFDPLIIPRAFTPQSHLLKTATEQLVSSSMEKTSEAPLDKKPLSYLSIPGILPTKITPKADADTSAHTPKETQFATTDQTLPIVQEDPTPEAKPRDPIMEIKEQSKHLIDSLNLGAEDFDENLNRLKEQLEQISILNKQFLEDSSKAAQTAAQRLEITKLAESVLNRIRAIDEDCELDRVQFRCDEDQSIDLARAECIRLAELLEAAEKQSVDLHTLLNNPLSSDAKKTDHVRRAQQLTALHANFLAQFEQIKQAIDTLLFFNATPLIEEQPPTTVVETSKGVASTLEPQHNTATNYDLKNVIASKVDSLSDQQSSRSVSPKQELDASSLDLQDLTVVEEVQAPFVAGDAVVDSAPEHQHIPASSIPTITESNHVSPFEEVIDPVAQPNEEFSTELTVLTESNAAPPATIYAEKHKDVAQAALAKPEPSTAKSKVPSDFLTTSEHELQAAYVTLRSLIRLRHYGLAQVFVDSINASFAPSLTNNNGYILSALVGTLDSLDCNFIVDARLHPDLRRLLTQNALNGENKFTHLGVFAAGFVSALFSGVQSGLSTEDDALWTVVDPVRPALSGCHSITALINHLISRERKGIVLTREKISASHIGPKKAMEAELIRSRSRAENWKRDSEIYTGWSYQGFGRAQDYIFGPKHPIGQCLLHLARGDESALRKAFEAAQGKFKKPNSTLIEAFRNINDKSRPEGPQTQHLCENIAITERFITSYLERVSNQSSKADLLLKHEQQYLGTLFTIVTEVLQEIASFTPQSEIDRIYIETSKTIFEAVLRLFDEQSGLACIAAPMQKLLVQLPMDRSFNPSINSEPEYNIYPLCFGADVIEAIEDLLRDDLAQLPSPIDERVVQSLLADAQRSHVEQKRFLPALAIEALLNKGYSKLDAPILQQFQKAKADLNLNLQDARQRVTHAMVLSALDQKDASSFLRLIASIQDSNTTEKGIGHPEGASSAYPDFPHALAALQSKVITVLDRELEVAKEKQNRELTEYEDLHGDQCKVDVQRIRAMLQTNNPASIRAAYDAFSILRNGGKLPSSAVDERRHPPMEFEAFIKELNNIRGQSNLLDSLKIALESDAQGLPDIVSCLSTEQRQEAAQFIYKWQTACSAKGSEAAELACQFFAELGIGKPFYAPERTSRGQIPRIEFPRNAFANLANNDCFVPPALGSKARLVICYIVAGFSPESDINSIVQDAIAPTFILSRANLTLQKRIRVTGHQPVLLIDDNLISYMALHPEDRARRMMEIATLSFHTLPYSAEGTFVPREMFFGRQEELSELRQVQNLAILYGGRRLGKSSLLAQIEREESKREGDIAIYLPLDQDYAGDDHVLFAWKKIASAFASNYLMEPVNRQESNWRNIREAIQHALVADSQKYKSCYLLLDEADVMMGHELELAPNQTGFIRSLQDLAETVAKKFHLRFVIAGLHNLARMTTESNSALGKAKVIAIEPFSSLQNIKRAVELITKPMAALGFFFAEGSEDLPMRVLSLCNFYPAFIQIYCSKLLEHMYNKRGTSKPWTYITTADLDAVERDEDLLTELQQKFAWTLDLDKRYKAIALILADYYYSEIETGKHEGLSVADIRMFCEMEAGGHFKNMSSGAYEGLVDEMRKLNVLERNGNRYRLRNPSIAMLIGDRERVQMQLKVLSETPAESTRNHGDRRKVLEPIGNSSNQAKQRIFPMPIAWTHAYLDNPGAGLVILAGNDQSGLPQVSKSKFEAKLTQSDQYSCFPVLANNLLSWNMQLRKRGGSEVKGGLKMIVSSSPSWSVKDIAQFASYTAKLLAYGIKLALAASPDRLYEISNAIAEGTLTPATDKQNDWVVEPIPAWSKDALIYFLHDNSAVTENDQACQAILDASCGFGHLIEELCSDGHLTVEKALSLPAYAQQHIAPDLATFYEKIGMPSHIDPDKRRRMEGFLAYINGEKRNSPEVADYMKSFDLRETDLQFMIWMGLVREADGNKWHVPSLYMRLISQTIS